jgi:hypothetical protein
MTTTSTTNRRAPTRSGAVLFAAAVVRPSSPADLQGFRREVTATKESAIAFLQRAGLVTPSGRPKQLIRG